MAASDPIAKRLERLAPAGIDLTLDRMRGLLAALGDPHERLPPVIHVAGTNGKGSVIAFLRAFLEAAGHRVHVFTSPHLVRMNEMIRLAGQPIDEPALLALLDEVAATGLAVTRFEAITACAFLAFARQPADFTLLECGMGARLDATNVIRRPILTVLTHVSLDHQEFLGRTVQEIAADKVFVMKPGAPCVVADQERKVKRVVEGRSLEVGCALYHEGKDFFVRSNPRGGITYQGRSLTWELPPPALAGVHQQRNAGLALACVERLNQVEMPEAALARGLREVDWPARLQRLTRGPLVETLPPGWELWLDGGHNPDAAKALALSARNMWRDKPLSLVVGMLRNRNARAFVKPLQARIWLLRGVAIPGRDDCLTPAEVSDAAFTEGVALARPAESVAAGIADIVALCAEPGRILICGSLYLAGSVLADNG
ncbi:MAG: bifunctional folylpolyglutamate synthase/dihydrofolate synthase [Alphaproteobacteria bacterium]|nr:bifunctional folylpolyglutamate synthase/dihydrofolate synthase [Alphaproteobacteria bacterium]